jgi:fibro-slime domain-containing protein
MTPFLLLACTEYQLENDKQTPGFLESEPTHSQPDSQPRHSDPESKPHDSEPPCEAGYFADYYNLTLEHPDVEQATDRVGPLDTPFSFDWWDSDYFVFQQVDPGLVFGAPWWPVDEGKPGDPQHFAVHWQAWIEVSQNKRVRFQLGSDDDSWALIDDLIVASLPGLHAVEQTEFSVDLTQGLHKLDLYMADRHTSNAGFWFVWVDEDVKIYSCPD